MTLPGTRKKFLLAAFTIGLSLANSPLSLAENQTEPKKEKAAKTELKKESPKNNKQEKAKEANKKAQEKAKKGFFHKDNQETQAKVETPKSREKEELARPEFEPDAALISVLKDLNRGLLDSAAVSQITDANERFVLGLSKELLAKALASGKLKANRIVAAEEENRVGNAITTESWASGEIEVNPEFKGSLAAIWAKRIDGLLTVSVAGDCRDRKAPDGSPVGEFLVVMSARSPVEKGFDIQSQGDVTFWLGKLQSINVESSCIKKPEPAEAKSGEKKSQTRANHKKQARAALTLNAKPISPLAPLLTSRYKQHYDLLILTDERRRQLAQSLAEMSVESPLAEAQNKEVSKEENKPKEEASDKTAEKVAAAEKQDTGEVKKEEPVAASRQEEKAKTLLASQTEPTKQESNKQEPTKQEQTKQESTEPVKAEEPKQLQTAKLEARTRILPPKEEFSIERKSIVENKPAFFHEARLDSKLLLPERALAGQYLTVALLDATRAGESNVELSFNGASLITDNLGQAVFLVPEDSAPGRSLNIALTSRPSELPATIDVLHPLDTPEEGEAPRLDRASHLVSSSSILVLDGHNFDGLASGNRVIIDGTSDGQIFAASPVQLKIALPSSLAPGLHTLCVSTQGKRSNPLAFEYAQASVQNDPREKDNGNKIVVKVLGTQSKVTLRLVNKSPELIKLSHGLEATTTSSGGTDNSAVINVQRLKKGQAKMEAQVEL